MRSKEDSVLIEMLLYLSDNKMLAINYVSPGLLFFSNQISPTVTDLSKSSISGHTASCAVKNLNEIPGKIQ